MLFNKAVVTKSQRVVLISVINLIESITLFYLFFITERVGNEVGCELVVYGSISSSL